MRKIVPLLLILSMVVPVSNAEISSVSRNQDTWANWARRLDRATKAIPPKKVPGRPMGIMVPQDSRADLLPLASFGYEILSRENLRSVIMLLPTPVSYPTDGLIMPNVDNLETSIGSFPVDTRLVSIFQEEAVPLTVDNALFAALPPILENQLAMLKYSLKGNSRGAKVLPVFVRFSDINNQVKDLGPALADAIKDNGMTSNITVIIAADISQALTEEALIPHDNIYLNAIRNLDVDPMVEMDRLSQNEAAMVTTPNIAPVALGLLMLRFLGADHGEILAYVQSGQMILTKSRHSLVSYVAGAIASGPPYPVKIPHVRKEKLEEIFDDDFRSELLKMTRQACASILDPTAAKPPALTNREAAKKWPVYISLYTPEGKLGGQAGAHVPVGPLEESIRQFAFEAVRAAKINGLDKTNFKNWVVDVSIPHGFSKISRPEDLIPLLHGLIVLHEHKRSAFHPDAWRTYPDPHQLLSSICTKLGLVPWAYSTDLATLESFRILSFNEKDPYQVLISRKKKKKGPAEEDAGDSGDSGGGDAGGGGGFGF